MRKPSGTTTESRRDPNGGTITESRRVCEGSRRDYNTERNRSRSIAVRLREMGILRFKEDWK